MLIYQELMDAAKSETVLADFISRAIGEHQSSDAYRTVETARKYYDGHNETISQKENLIFDEFGDKFKDVWTPNHKLKSRFFKNAVDQRVSYLLANGVTFGNPETKQRLGTAKKPFDSQIFVAATEAYIGGASYTFFDNDHAEVFPFESYIPAVDWETGEMRAGLRHWRLSKDTPLIVHFFEGDGYSVFRENDGRLERYGKKQSYRQKVISSKVSREVLDGEPYPAFPIVPLYCNRNGTPLLVGNQDTIDALDVARSTGVNHVDSDLVYWLFMGLQGMNDFDIVQALADLRRLHGLAVPPAGDGVSITPHTVQAPFEGTQRVIAELKEQLNFDFQIFNAQSVIASSDTATAIRAAYENLNIATNVFELQHLNPYVSQILELADIKDTFTFKRDAITNVQEAMQTLIMLAPYVDAEYVRQAGMTIWGDADKIEEVSARMAEEASERLANAT